MHFKMLVPLSNIPSGMNATNTEVVEYLSGVMQQYQEQKQKREQGQPVDMLESVNTEMAMDILPNFLSEFSHTVYLRIQEILKPYMEGLSVEFESDDSIMEHYQESAWFVMSPDKIIVPAEYIHKLDYTEESGHPHDEDDMEKDVENVSHHFQFDWNTHTVLEQTSKGTGEAYDTFEITDISRQYCVYPIPWTVIYPIFKDYVLKEYGEKCWNESLQKAGYWYNPDTIYDWYQLGGRYSKAFLIKDTVTEYIAPAHERPAPGGYRWAYAARKKDIDFAKTYEFIVQEYIEDYYHLKGIFDGTEEASGQFQWCQKREDGLYQFGDIAYIAGETEEEYLKRKFPNGKEWVYTNFYAYFLPETEYYDERWNYQKPQVEGQLYADQDTNAWNAKMKEVIDARDDDDVFVIVDCHI